MLLRDSALIYFHVKVAYIALFSSIQECIFFMLLLLMFPMSHMRDEFNIFIFSIQNMFYILLGLGIVKNLTIRFDFDSVGHDSIRYRFEFDIV